MAASSKVIQKSIPMDTSDDEEEEVDFEERKEVSLYNVYTPSITLNGAVPHPQRVCEADALSWVSPPKLTYVKVQMPKDLFKKVSTKNPPLSIAQLEAVLYACDAHSKFIVNVEHRQTRQGFLIGDGTGLGKGRIISGIITENWYHGRKKSVWISANTLLAESCRQEMQILLRNLPFIELANFKDEKKMQFPEGVCFLTYSALADEKKFLKLKEWLGNEFDGVIAFDECHLAKSFANPADLKRKRSLGGRDFVEKQFEGSKIGGAVVKLQEMFPLARIVYSSATAASEIHHLLYMQRLGIWGPSTCFKTAKDFYLALEKRGTTALELLCIELKMKGVLVARQISFDGVVFVTKKDKYPCADFEEMYRRCTQLWLLMLGYVHEAVDSKNKTAVLRLYWGHSQRFFNSLIVTGKLRRTVDLAMEFEGRFSSIFGLQHTGEAQYETFLSQTKNTENQPYSYAEYALRAAFECIGLQPGYDSSFNAVVDSSASHNRPSKLPRTEFLTWPTNCIGSFSNRSATLVKWSFETCRDEGSKGLIQLFHELRPLLPINPLDDLIDRLGGPSKVSELTSRKYAPVRTEKIWKKGTCSGIAEEHKKFMSGEKEFVVISDVSSLGFSLHADIKSGNTKTRYHFTCEHAWIPEKSVQQMGRSHRSEQKQCPVYVFVESPVAAEARIIQNVAKRLRQMGAITHAESKINHLKESGATGEIFTPLGELAVKEFVSCIRAGTIKKGDDIMDYIEQLQIMNPKKNINVKRFLNRLLVMPLQYQKEILHDVDKLLARSKIRGIGYDSILEFPDAGKKYSMEYTDIGSYLVEDVAVNLHRFDIDRTCDWETVTSAAETKTCRFMHREATGSIACVFQIQPKSRNYEMLLPWNRNKTPVTASTLGRLKYRAVCKEEAEALWTAEYDLYQKNPANCQHIVRYGKCRFVDGCDYQWGKKHVHLITGGVHGVWEVLERLFNKKISLARVTHSNGNKFIGVFVEDPSMTELKGYLERNDPDNVPKMACDDDWTDDLLD